METSLAVLRTIAIVVVCAAAAVCFGLFASMLRGAQTYVDESGGWGSQDYSEAQVLIDGLTDAAVAAPTLDPDEPLLAQRRIVIAEGINEVTARLVIERLLHLDAVDPDESISLLVSTQGGWTDSAFAIVDTMRAIRAPVDVTATGGCYSAGTLILAAGTGVRAATPNTVLSVHVNDYDRSGDPLGSDTSELRRFVELYRRYTDVPVAWFEEPGDNQFYFDAARALELRLIDEIAQPRWKAPPVRERPAERPAA